MDVDESWPTPYLEAAFQGQANRRRLPARTLLRRFLDIKKDDG